MSNNYHHHHHNHQLQPPPLPPSLQQQQMNEPPHPYSHNQGNSIQAIHNINQQNSYPIHHQQSFLPNHQSQQFNQHYLGQSPPLPAPPPLPHTFTVPQGVPPQSQFQNQNQQGPNFPLPPPQAIVTNIKDIPQNVNTFITTTTKKSTTPLQTPKKKRGRPPKPDSLAQKITTTLNININASPPNSNPAELNSNLMVKRGAPDAFTPLMRVSPTHPLKRRRKSSVGTTTSGSPTAKRSKSTKKSNKTTTNDTPHLVTPLSSSSDGHFPSSEHSYQFDYKTLDKLSMVTQSQGYYNTPPPTSTNASFSTPNQPRHASGLPTPREQLNNNSKIYSSESSQLSKINECKQESTSPSKNLLPPVSLTSNSNNNTHSLDKLKGSPIKINREKPTSPIEIVPKSNNINAITTTTTTNTNTTVDSIKSRKQSSSSSAEEFLFKLTIDDLGKAVLSGDMFAPTKLSMELVPSHPRSPKKSSPIQNSPSPKQVIDTPSTLVQSNSVIGIETFHTDPKVKAPLRRHNSDITNFTSSARDSLPILSSINEAAIQSNNPQTPKDTYTYASTGLTPLFNLTPQFNALMYSVMNLNGSPSPFKRANNPFLVNQEIFTGCGVNESNSQQQQQQQSNTSSSLSSQSQQLEELVEQPHLEDHQSDLSSELLNSKDATATDIIQQNYLLTSSSSSLDESGDARLALKKIIHVKRQ